MGNRKYTIITFFSLAIFLISLSFFTINITYAYVPENDIAWNIYLGDAIYKNNDKQYEITTNSEYVYFKATLVDYGDDYGFMIPITNDGNIDAYLRNYDKTILDQEVGVGESGKTYYVKDFVSYTVMYGEANVDNNINASASLRSGDILKSHTMNYIFLNVKFINKERLSAEAIEVLDNSNFKVEQDGNLVNGFNLELSLSMSYQELK